MGKLLQSMKKFDDLKKRIAERSRGGGGGKKWGKFDIGFKPGHTFVFRLIYFENEDSEREGPFINKYTHSVKGSDGKWKVITCPTTFFPSTGFEKCPLCKNNSRLWNSGVEADKELYRRYKRRFSGYALAYVVNDPVNPDNNGHVRRFRYGKTIHNWLNKEIFGVADEGEIIDAVGFDAFKFDDGYDLIIEVSKKGEWNDYECKFARKPSDISVDLDTLEAEIGEIDFDAELRASSESDLENYYRKYVLEEDSGSVDTGETIASRESDSKTSTPPAVSAPSTGVDDDVEALLNDINGDTAESTPEPQKPEPKKAEKAPASTPTKEEDDIDDLLADIENDING